MKCVVINIIARKLDDIHEEKVYGEKIIKDSLVGFDRRIEERKKKRD